MANDDRTALEHLATSLIGAQAAVSTISASAAVLAAASCLTVPGQVVLVPGWICSGVVHALVHAGVRPLGVDVDAGFGMSANHATDMLDRYDVGLVLHAPYGGDPRGLMAWKGWADRAGLPLVVDLAQAPDPTVWRAAGRIGAVTVTSFRPGKPVGAEGGGVLTGAHDLIDRIRVFLEGGRDRAGRKVAVGMELPLHPTAALAARSALAGHADRVPGWRASTARSLDRLHDVLLPGWQQITGVALSRIPCLDGQGRPLHPDRAYRMPAVRESVALRLGDADAPVLPRLDRLYDRIRVVKVGPEPGP